MPPKCPIESTLSLINGKWKLLILKSLSRGPLRYGVLEKRIPGVSAKVLTQQLREMEKDGLLIRTIFPEVPPRVEYSLDKMGITIFGVFVAMRNWGLGEDQVHEIECSECAECQPVTG
ncbi:MAG: helix-turn-helix transcriptional regulator [Synergistaceae bacterium]|jgi:DNA-binding HxlR family transcriptional regulator|nr:helix-turn-helix transcriptional regulator [Synergistaceae bacterium]